MIVKLRPVVLCVSLLSLFCFGLNFVGVGTSLFAQDAQAIVEKVKSAVEREVSDAKAAPVNEPTQPCCKQGQTCIHQKKCANKLECKTNPHACRHDKSCPHKPGCDTPCKKRSGCCKSGDGHSVDDLLNIVNCAKKKLLKEKIKANLETKIGAKLDKVAVLLVDTMLEEYKAGSASKERREALGKKLDEIFSEKGGQ